MSFRRFERDDMARGLQKSAAEAHRLLVEAYNEAALSERTCREWLQKFKNGDFDVEDKDRSERPKIYEDTELEGLSEEDSYQTQKKLALNLVVTQQAVSQNRSQHERSGRAGQRPPRSATLQPVECLMRGAEGGARPSSALLPSQLYATDDLLI
ncbi:Mariner Mos1 transposase [Eumeta japonica]|uniref:Mariner Mos1 transposase n=1 Tax=Eumeta variegata TaxID=151549 RepID=A0A4C1Y4Y6_EUMVA|nr:Mariner Mos1 transposase [Eumeta japonica]